MIKYSLNNKTTMKKITSLFHGNQGWFPKKKKTLIHLMKNQKNTKINFKVTEKE